jgi:hypothetical protein
MADLWETIFRYYGIDWVALALNATAIYLLGKKRKAGFSLGIVANIAWIVFAILAHSVATVVACTIFILLNVKGWWSWAREDASTEHIS